jgi:hypothetical protein
MTKLKSTLIALFMASTMLSANAAEIKTGNSNGIPTITISGEIEAGDEKTFDHITVFTGLKRVFVYLNSPGGLMDPALAIGKQIAALSSYETVVSQHCASSCALIWLAGRQRYVFSKASIGFHGVYLADSLKISPDGNAVVGAYLARLGYSDKAIEWMTAADPNSMQWLDSKTAKELGVDATVLRSKE